MKPQAIRNIAIMAGALGAGFVTTAGMLGATTAATSDATMGVVAMCLGAAGGGLVTFSAGILKFYPAPPPEPA